MKIQKSVLDKIIIHAKKDKPIEACGYLAQKNGIVSVHYELPNVDKSHEHFSFDPKDQFSTLKKARGNGLEICAVYHSHPNTPARPSDEDIKLAYDPNLSYVIISLMEPVTVKSFKINQSKEEVLTEDFEVMEND